MPGAVVLIVEDDYVVGEYLKETLPQNGYRTLFAPDGRAGLELARKHKPDVVLLDLMLPGIDGFEVCRRLKSAPDTAGAKVIMITALGRMSDVERAFSAGAMDYVIKPFDLARILAKLDKALGRS